MATTAKEYHVKYDGRFGFHEHLDSCLWICNRERHGEVWVFKFDNGYSVMVERTACWKPSYVTKNICTSGGYAKGFYEFVVYLTENGSSYVEDRGVWLDYDEVQNVLRKTHGLEKRKKENP